MLAADLLCAQAALGPVDAGIDCQADSAYVEMATAGLHTRAAATKSGGQAGNNGSSNGGQGTPGANVGQGELSQAEEDSLLHMREEEKLAHDVYVTLELEWNVPIFGNIAAAESQHMEAVGLLIDKYGLVDPVGEHGLGEFENPAFEDLYKDLVARGEESLTEAYRVGALIEELDIYDLREAITDVHHDDITQTYENLLRGSRNHLRAFAAQLDALGESYVVDGDYLTQAEFDAIAASPQETGGGQGQGQTGRPNRQAGSENTDHGQRAGERTSGSRSQDSRSSRRDRDHERIRPVSRDNATTTRHEQIRDRLFTQFGAHSRFGLHGGQARH